MTAQLRPFRVTQNGQDRGYPQRRYASLDAARRVALTALRWAHNDVYFVGVDKRQPDGSWRQVWTTSLMVVSAPSSALPAEL